MHFSIVSLVAVSVLLLAACKSPEAAVDHAVDTTDRAAAARDTSLVYTNAIHVLVNGRIAGTIPRTVRIRRSFGNHVVSLYQAGEELRTYEINNTSTAEGEQTRMGFWGTRTMDGETYDVRNLPQEDGTYEVPFTRGPMKIEDREYGVTLLIRE